MIKIKNRYNLSIKENIFLAKKTLVASIYNSARLEGIDVTFPDTKTILDGVAVGNMNPDDLQTILNLRNAWRYVLDRISEPLTLDLARGVNARVSYNESLEWGVLRTGEVGIGGTDWRPPVPIERDVLGAMEQTLRGDGFDSETDRALTLWGWMMRSQLFWDGNKRTAGISVNHYMISNGLGVLSVPVQEIANFNRALTAFYESGDCGPFKEYAHNACIHGLEKSEG